LAVLVSILVSHPNIDKGSAAFILFFVLQILAACCYWFYFFRSMSKGES
jgi:uncharacterized membrane protein